MTQTMELEKRDPMMMLTGKNKTSYAAVMRHVNRGYHAENEQQTELDLTAKATPDDR